MMKRLNSLLLVAVMVAAIAAACGGDPAPDADDPADAGATNAGSVVETTTGEPGAAPLEAPDRAGPAEPETVLADPAPDAVAYAPNGAALGSAVDNTLEIVTLTEGIEVDRPEELAMEIAALIDGDGDEGPTATVAEVISGEPATAYVVVTGLPDDSVSGGVLTITMDPDDAVGWGVTMSTSTPICGRGVSQQGLCL